MRCEDIATHPDFRHLHALPGLAVDLRYAGTDNFVGRDLYGSLDCAWLHHLAADGLERAAELLHREAPGHRLLVLDALRRDLALEFVTGSRNSLAEIAYLLGFSEPAALSRAFQRWTGMTPGQYRRRDGASGVKAAI